MNTGTISNPSLTFKPSKTLTAYIKNLKVENDMPVGIKNILFKNRLENKESKLDEPKYFLTEKDREYIRIQNLISPEKLDKHSSIQDNGEVSKSDKLLKLPDLYWLQEHIETDNKNNDKKVYFHELFEGTKIIFPKNDQIPRSEELEKRCERYRIEMNNKEYHRMTQKVSSYRKIYPEDTIAYQLKEMNKHLIAIFQFIVSVVAGFAFGFIGIEVIIGTLDFGFRLLLGIICALVIALAELYFLAKKLNEDVLIENEIRDKIKRSKID